MNFNINDRYFILVTCVPYEKIDDKETIFDRLSSLKQKNIKTKKKYKLIYVNQTFINHITKTQNTSTCRTKITIFPPF